MEDGNTHIISVVGFLGGIPGASILKGKKKSVHSIALMED
jgi:hypothetical protein